MAAVVMVAEAAMLAAGEVAAHPVEIWAAASVVVVKVEALAGSDLAATAVVAVTRAVGARGSCIAPFQIGMEAASTSASTHPLESRRPVRFQNATRWRQQVAAVRHEALLVAQPS